MNLKNSENLLYAVAVEPTPVFNTPDYPESFGCSDGMTLKLDNEGLFRDLEYIAFTGTVFTILKTLDRRDYKIYNVVAEDYNYEAKLYIDSRFVNVSESKPHSHEKSLPSIKEKYDFLDKAIEAKYIWASNYIAGIDKLMEFYPPKSEISEEIKDKWIFRGCDCSGLMYEATNGWTERNTWKIINSGKPVDIEGMSAKEIKSKLKPLDAIVWNGHVIYVYDENTAIQSALSRNGVIKTDLLETIEQTMIKRKPVNDYDKSDGGRFVVKRWYPEQL